MNNEYNRVAFKKGDLLVLAIFFLRVLLLTIVI